MSNTAAAPKDTPFQTFNDLKTGDFFEGEEIKLIYVCAANHIIYKVEGGRWFKVHLRNNPDQIKIARHIAHLRRLFRYAGQWLPVDRQEAFCSECAMILDKVFTEPSLPLSVWDDLLREIEQHAIDKTGLGLLAATIVSGICLFAFSIITLGAYPGYSATLDESLIAALFGVAGAFTSILLRIPELTIKSCHSKLTVILQGSTRMMLGFIFGGFAWFAIEANVIGGIASNSATATWILVFCAGFSERMIPDTIRGIEAAAVAKQERAPSEDLDDR